jgi:predicted methyltransferase
MIEIISSLLFIYLFANSNSRSINGMSVTKFANPYNGNKTTFRNTVNKSGVYLIKENGIIVYIGYSKTNLYRTLYRHFQQWNHKYQEVITYVNKLNRNRYTVRVVLCSPTRAEKLEAALIQKYNPRDNYMKLKKYEIDPEAGKKEVEEYYSIKPANPDDPF